MSSGPETTTNSSQDSTQKVNSKTKTQQEMDAEQLVQAQQQSLTGTQSVGQTATQNVGQQQSLQDMQQATQNIGSTQNTGQSNTVNTGQQLSQNVGATQNTGQSATQNTGQQTSTNLGQQQTQNVGQQQNVGQAATQNTGLQQSQNVGQQQTQNVGQQATQNVGQAATQNLGQQATANLGATTGQTTSQGLAIAQPMLQQILDTAGGVNTGTNAVENAALQGITDTAQQNAATFNPQIQNLAQDQFAGGGFGTGQQGVVNAGQAATDAYNKVLNPDMTGQNNPYLQSLLGTIQDRVRNQVGSQFANAGRSFSGAHMDALAKGMSAGLADPLLQNYWKERDAQMNAAGQLQTSALATSGELDRIKAAQLAARGQGAETLNNLYSPYQTALQAGNYQAAQPLERLGMLGNLATGIANTGGTQNTVGTQAQAGLTNTANTGLTSTADTGLTNTATSGLANTMDAGQVATQNAGLTSTSDLSNTLNTGLINSMNTGQVNTANQGLTNTQDTSNTQQLGMLDTMNTGQTNTQDTSNTQNYGLLNQSQQGLVNTANAGLTNTSDSSLTAATQAANQLTNSAQDANSVSKTKGKTTGTTTGTSTSQTASDPFQIGVGLLTGLGGLLSDRRMKRDIQQIGVTFDGLPIYRFRYLTSDLMHVGFMADEVEERTPHAVSEIGGVKHVNYELATEGALR